MRSRVSLLARLSILMLVAIATMATAALPASAEAAPCSLSADHPSVSGSLGAGQSGGFFTCVFNTKAGRAPVIITLDVDKTYNGMLDKIGFDVYRIADGAWVSRSGANQDMPNATNAFAPVANSRAVPHLLQIFNYAGPINFTLSAVYGAPAGTQTDRGPQWSSLATGPRARSMAHGQMRTIRSTCWTTPRPTCPRCSSKSV